MKISDLVHHHSVEPLGPRGANALQLAPISPTAAADGGARAPSPPPRQVPATSSSYQAPSTPPPRGASAGVERAAQAYGLDPGSPPRPPRPRRTVSSRAAHIINTRYRLGVEGVFSRAELHELRAKSAAADLVSREEWALNNHRRLTEAGFSRDQIYAMAHDASMSALLAFLRTLKALQALKLSSAQLVRLVTRPGACTFLGALKTYGQILSARGMSPEQIVTFVVSEGNAADRIESFCRPAAQ